MRPAQHRPSGGFTLTEMLVVLTIVALLTAISIPSLVRMGAFTSNETGDGARDLYQMLRAAKVYATTNNLEIALVYRARFVYETANDDLDAVDMVPVIDGYLICERLSRDDVLALNTVFDDVDTSNVPPDDQFAGDEVIFIPIEGSSGGFREMPSQTCVLPDVFEVDPGSGLSVSGLSSVWLLDPAFQPAPAGETGFAVPPPHLSNNAVPLHFEQDDSDPRGVALSDPPAQPETIYAFPAHRFSPSGEISPPQDVQRFSMRVGLKPSALPRDRFVTDDSDVLYTEYRDLVGDPTGGTPLNPLVFPTDTEPVTIQFHRMDLVTPAPTVDTEVIPRFYFPRRAPLPARASEADFDILLENFTSVIVYTATGRVKIDSGT